VQVSLLDGKAADFQGELAMLWRSGGLRFGGIERTSPQMPVSHRAGPAASMKNHAHDCAWSRAIVLGTGARPPIPLDEAAIQVCRVR
jgi:hypothetical protein